MLCIQANNAIFLECPQMLHIKALSNYITRIRTEYQNLHVIALISPCSIRIRKYIEWKHFCIAPFLCRGTFLGCNGTKEKYFFLEHFQTSLFLIRFDCVIIVVSSQTRFICSKSAIEILEKDVNYVKVNNKDNKTTSSCFIGEDYGYEKSFLESSSELRSLSQRILIGLLIFLLRLNVYYVKI